MNKASIRDLIAAQVPRLRRYAVALTGDGEAADDLVQDCLERAWRKKEHWEPGTDLRAWLFTVMHNVHVNNLRRPRPQTFPMVPGDLNRAASDTPEKAMRLRDLQTGLQNLSEEHREVLLLVCLESLSYEQTAAVLGIPVGTVMSRLHRGREKLRSWMDGQHPEAPVLRRVK